MKEENNIESVLTRCLSIQHKFHFILNDMVSAKST